MTDKAKLIFLVLTISGTLCIWASLVAICFLYQQNAAVPAMPAPSGAVPREVMFGVFVGLPSLVTFVAGIGMAIVGIVFGLKDRSL
jgi:hypothetical protein